MGDVIAEFRVEAERAPAGAPVALTTSEARRRRGEGIERATDQVVLLATRGSGTHMIDFEDHEVAAGTLIHVQPGQVHRFDAASRFHAYVISVSPDVCPVGLFEVSDPLPVVPLGPAASIVLAVAQDLRAEQREPRPCNGVMTAGAVLILHHLARLASIDRPTHSDAHQELVLAFRASVEERFTHSRNVSDYARSIGASTKTLARATLGSTGLTPKEIIDQRVVLEAKRRLAESGDSIASVGVSLGFSEATNFTKYFVRLTGQTPVEFRG